MGIRVACATNEYALRRREVVVHPEVELVHLVACTVRIDVVVACQSGNVRQWKKLQQLLRNRIDVLHQLAWAVATRSVACRGQGLACIATGAVRVVDQTWRFGEHALTLKRRWHSRGDRGVQ